MKRCMIVLSVLFAMFAHAGKILFYDSTSGTVYSDNGGASNIVAVGISTTNPIVPSNSTFLAINATRDPIGCEEGIENKITFLFTNSTRTFVIQTNGDNSWSYYHSGTKTTISSNVVLSISTNLGIHYLSYSAPNGSLVDSMTPWTFSNHVQIAYVYWDGVEGTVGYEAHGIAMDWATHEYLHETVGVRLASGLTGVYGVGFMTNASGEIHDEDISFSIAQQTNCLVIYHTNSVLNVRKGSNVPYKLDGSGVILYDTGTTTNQVAAGQYVASWVFASSVPSNPICVVIGQRVDSTLANARANNQLGSLVTGTLPLAEMKPLYRLIYHRQLGVGTLLYDEAMDISEQSIISSSVAATPTHDGTTGAAESTIHTNYPLLTANNTFPATATNTFLGGLYFGTTALNLSGVSAYPNDYQAIFWDPNLDQLYPPTSLYTHYNFGTADYYISNSWSWAEIRSFIWTIPRANYGTINVYFEDGTYVPDSSSPLNFDGFYGYGNLYIHGNTGEDYNTPHTNQAVIFDASTNTIGAVLQFNGCSLYSIHVRNIRVNVGLNGGTGNAYGFYATRSSCDSILFSGCYSKGTSISTTAPAGQQYGYYIDRCRSAAVAYSVWDNVRFGIGSYQCDLIEADCMYMGVMPAYAFNPLAGSITYNINSSATYQPPPGSLYTMAYNSAYAGKLYPDFLPASRSFVLSNTWSRATINGIIDALPRDLRRSTLTLQFEAGTYALDAALEINNFSDGSLAILGANAGSGKYTNQTTVLLGDGDFNVMRLWGNTTYTYLRDIKFISTNNAADRVGVMVWNTPHADIRECYFVGGTTTYGKGVETVYGSSSFLYQNYFNNMKYAVFTDMGGQSSVQDCAVVGTTPTYGKRVLRSGVNGNYDTSVLGTTDNSPANGGIIVTSAGATIP